MSKKLATAVHLTDDSGVVHSFLPGQTVPKWARKRITNPKAWAADESGEDTSDDGTDSGDVSGDGSDDQTGDGSQGSDEIQIPKKNASAAVWRDYADKKGFEIDEDVPRKDIIAALEANGVPVE